MDAETRITWAERGLDLVALALGVTLLLAAPTGRVLITRPMVVVLAGVVLLATGLARDLARIALLGRPVAAPPDRHPGELRLCLESTLGLGAVAAGLAWWLWAAPSAGAWSLGALTLLLAVVAAFGHLARNLVLVVRAEPAHRNVVFWS
jgi:hypothetical protein